jgi:hypothetical protein
MKFFEICFMKLQPPFSQNYDFAFTNLLKKCSSASLMAGQKSFFSAKNLHVFTHNMIF